MSWHTIAATGAALSGGLCWVVSWWLEERARRKRASLGNYSVRPDDRDAMEFFRRRNS